MLPAAVRSWAQTHNMRALMTASKRLAGFLPAVLLLLASAAAEARGQDTRGQETRGQETRDSTAAENGRVERPVSGGTLLDAPVSRREYALGPGDVVNVSIFGEVTRSYRVSITPEGTAVIPGIGVARVLGANLDEAERRVESLVFRYFRNVDVHLNLAEVRQFKVFLVGNVPNPGVRIASAVTRVSEVVSPRRNIFLRRANGDTLRVDLVRFQQTGDLGANPVLNQGDVLNVPMVDETVQVFGRVFFPGTYEYRRGESLAELLSVANGAGGFPASAADTIRVTRFINRDQRETHAFSRAEVLGARGRGFLLQPFDAIYLPELSNFKQQQTATISGQVLRPGTYPIRPDTTTVRELVALAGGFTPEASLVNATLRRQLPGVRVAEDLDRIPAELLSREERQIMRIRAQGSEANVVVDFQALFAQGQNVYDQPLRAGDALEVPRRREEVVVLGAVRKPGVVPFAAGNSPEFFVSRAGGFSRLADRGDAVVLRARQDTRIAASDVTSVDPGDTIVVPFRERRNWLQVLQATGTVVTTITGLVLSFIAIDRSL